MFPWCVSCPGEPGERVAPPWRGSCGARYSHPEWGRSGNGPHPQPLRCYFGLPGAGRHSTKRRLPAPAASKRTHRTWRDWAPIGRRPFKGPSQAQAGEAPATGSRDQPAQPSVPVRTRILGWAGPGCPMPAPPFRPGKADCQEWGFRTADRGLGHGCPLDHHLGACLPWLWPPILTTDNRGRGDSTPEGLEAPSRNRNPRDFRLQAEHRRCVM